MTGIPSMAQEPVFSVNTDTLRRIYDLLPDDNEGIRWKDLVEQTTGNKAKKKLRMSKQTLSEGLKVLISMNAVEKKAVKTGRGILYKRTPVPEDVEDIEMVIKLSDETMDKIKMRYQQLAYAKKWVEEYVKNDSSITPMTDKELREYVDSEIKRRCAEIDFGDDDDDDADYIF